MRDRYLDSLLAPVVPSPASVVREADIALTDRDRALCVGLLELAYKLLDEQLEAMKGIASA